MAGGMVGHLEFILNLLVDLRNGRRRLRMLAHRAGAPPSFFLSGHIANVGNVPNLLKGVQYIIFKRTAIQCCENPQTITG